MGKLITYVFSVDRYRSFCRRKKLQIFACESNSAGHRHALKSRHARCRNASGCPKLKSYQPSSGTILMQPCVYTPVLIPSCEQSDITASNFSSEQENSTSSIQSSWLPGTKQDFGKTRLQRAQCRMSRRKLSVTSPASSSTSCWYLLLGQTIDPVEILPVVNVQIRNSEQLHRGCDYT